MRKYVNQEEKSLQKIICNKCGKEIVLENGIAREETFHGEAHWGYFSQKDGEIHSFDLCEECYDQWIRTFAVGVTVENENELL